MHVDKQIFISIVMEYKSNIFIRLGLCISSCDGYKQGSVIIHCRGLFLLVRDLDCQVCLASDGHGLCVFGLKF